MALAVEIWISPIVTVLSIVGSVLAIVWFIQKQSRQFTNEVREIRNEFRDERMTELERRLDDIDDQVIDLQQFNDQVDRHLVRKAGFDAGWNQRGNRGEQS